MNNIGAKLEQNQPNPFNPDTRIFFTLDTPAKVKLEVFNVLGQHVVTLVDEALPAGEHEAYWDGRNGSGYPAASGVYFYRLETPRSAQSKMMLLLK